MRLDVTDLRLFAAVAEAGSITRGAERAHLATASASERMAGMEEALGARLLERGRRGVRLTPAGEALLHHARIVLHQMERMRADLAGYARGVRGHVRLLTNTAALSEFLPDALAAFLAAHPGIDLDLEERPSPEIVEEIAAARADLGIVADTADPGQLETRPFRADRLVLVTARDHPLATRRDVTLTEVVDEPFIGLREGSALQDHLAGHAARLGRALRLRARLGSFEAVCRVVGKGVGVAIVPEAAARRSRRSAGIRHVPLAEPWAVRRLVLCARCFEDLPVPARSFADEMGSPAATGRAGARRPARPG